MAGNNQESNSESFSDLAFERPIVEIERKIHELEELASSTQLDLSGELESLKKKRDETIDRIYSEMTPWERVCVARHRNRPVTTDYIDELCEDFIELHGDGVFGDDRAIVTGLGTISGKRFMIIGHRKGRTTKARLACNFGCAHPEGYRKALRKMRLAERMQIPILCFVNTPGAYPGIAAEERGQARAIAENIYEMFDIKVPIIVIVIGEGGSGGALGIGVGNRVLILSNAYYSVISPEGCAAILWKDGERASDAAKALRLTAQDLKELDVVDEIIDEPRGGAHRDHPTMFAAVRESILRNLTELEQFSPEEIARQRYQKFRTISSNNVCLD